MVRKKNSLLDQPLPRGARQKRDWVLVLLGWIFIILTPFALYLLFFE